MANGNISANIKYNDKGERISGVRQLLSDAYWKKDASPNIDNNGEKIVDWEKFEAADVDDRGFDKTKSIEWYIIPKGTVIIRYGSTFGRYTAPEGTPYEALALPYVKDTVEFHRYKVISENGVPCEVDRGYVGHKFHSDGGGIQYYHLQGRIFQLLDKHIISELQYEHRK